MLQQKYQRGKKIRNNEVTFVQIRDGLKLDRRTESESGYEFGGDLRLFEGNLYEGSACSDLRRRSNCTDFR